MKKMEPVVLITQARTGSTRLPGKILKEVLGKKVIHWFLRRALKCESVSKVCAATTTNPADDYLVALLRNELPEVLVARGPEEDVLARYELSAKETDAGVVVRVTSDCPFFDWKLVDRCVERLKSARADAVRTVRGDYPIGLDVEVYTRRTLQTAHERAVDPFEREHVGPYVFQTHSSEFDLEWVSNEDEPWPECRLTLDYPEDFLLLEKLYFEVGPEAPAEEYRVFLTAHPEIARINLMRSH